MFTPRVRPPARPVALRGGGEEEGGRLASTPRTIRESLDPDVFFFFFFFKRRVRMRLVSKSSFFLFFSPRAREEAKNVAIPCRYVRSKRFLPRVKRRDSRMYIREGEITRENTARRSGNIQYREEKKKSPRRRPNSTLSRRKTRDKRNPKEIYVSLRITFLLPSPSPPSCPCGISPRLIYIFRNRN